MTRPTALCDVRPAVGRERLLTDLVPPRHFEGASFASYVPDPAHPSQQAAVERLAEVAEQLSAPARGLGAILRRRRAVPPAVYLDGGFGVGKTHLLAALAHALGPQRAAFGTFVEYTNLVGALGFAATVDALGALDLVCIDEFELDDPGDTVLVSRLLRELADRDVALAATSNTLPDALGEGRFAAEDFLREIQALSARFEVLRVDGEDYRQRAVVTDAHPLPDRVLVEATTHRAGATCDFLDDLLEHLRSVHPSRYGALLDGVELVALRGVRTVDRQDDALRLVVLADRLYDRGVPVLLGGDERTALFTAQMLAGGYRKKYLRTLSRLGALAQEGRELVAAGTTGAPTSS
ncbi:cell division protein ZapE [Sanguibacter massiliensis]|uniref:cell division protein ZapE n=1 Tax=Sanguibacter massiliensis TaxID=1973217 RepID=UPI000C84631B|nr:cell division protein ZapE [Sanguibacter massiliensis]